MDRTLQQVASRYRSRNFNAIILRRGIADNDGNIFGRTFGICDQLACQ
jgi:hypothetical protein